VAVVRRLRVTAFDLICLEPVNDAKTCSVQFPIPFVSDSFSLEPDHSSIGIQTIDPSALPIRREEARSSRKYPRRFSDPCVATWPEWPACLLGRRGEIHVSPATLSAIDVVLHGIDQQCRNN
jgi:hypothetical protein